jgi:hypothetical protein
LPPAASPLWRPCAASRVSKNLAEYISETMYTKRMCRGERAAIDKLFILKFLI